MALPKNEDSKNQNMEEDISKVSNSLSNTPPIIEDVTDTSKEVSSDNKDAGFGTDNVFPFEEQFGKQKNEKQNEEAVEEKPLEIIDNTWNEPTAHPEIGEKVLCETGSHLDVDSRSYEKGQFDDHTGNFFTCENGPYQILDVVRWMRVK